MKNEWTTMDAKNVHVVLCLLFIFYLTSTVLGACPTNCEFGQICSDADEGCPRCLSAYFGRQCEYPYECKRSSDGFAYRGHHSTTRDGHTCQEWALDSPHSHPYNYVEGSYCRNPDSYYRLWCYTTSPGERFDTCIVPDCSGQCSAPDLNVFGDIISSPRSGFIVDITVEIIGVCGPGTKANRTCLQSKTWTDPTDCTLIKWCVKPQLNPNSKVENLLEQYNYNDTITVSCDTGYEIQGQATLMCEADKTWGTIPTCRVVECPTPTLNPQSYITNPSGTYVYLDVIRVTCNVGYNEVGNTEFTCQANKMWNGQMPTCQRVPCPDPKNLLTPRSFIENYSPPYAFGDQITVSCITGYTVQGINQIYCASNGMWGYKMPTCEPVPCLKPTTLPEKTFIANPKPNYVFQDTISLSCDHGYAIKGSNVIICQADMKWGEIPACTVVECPSPDLPPNSVITQGKKNTYYYTDSIKINCGTGYNINGSDTTTCLHTGKWEKINGKCAAVACPDPITPSHSVIIPEKTGSYIYQDKIEITCSEGYSLNGRRHTSCLASGKWEPTDWVCEEIDTPNAAAIGGAAGGVAALAIIIIVIIVIVRRKSKNKATKYRNEPLDGHSDSSSTPMENMYSNSTQVAASSNLYVNVTCPGPNMVIDDVCPDAVYYNTVSTPNNKGIRIAELADFIKDKSNDQSYFQTQFSLLKSGLQRSTNEATKDVNKEKNKYNKIYPYDDNRVKLSKKPNSSGSDYINASPIKGYDGMLSYIAAQGPVKKSMNDFWRMIWEMKCSAIVMLTNLFEEGKTKCEQYWPEEGSTTYGEISVQLSDTDVYAEYTIRNMSVTKGDAKRMVHQFHFTAWPDKKVPKYTSSLAHFRRKVVNTPSCKEGPIIVHCSAGIGRTGTFIALDYLVNEFKNTGYVDILPCVERLRHQRLNMVQTKDQYAFLHSVLEEEYECERSTIKASEFMTKYDKLKKTNPKTGQTYIAEEFRILEKTSPVFDEDDVKAGKLSENKNKNRYNNVLPVDAHRPFLIGDGENNYINAVFLPGYRNNKAYIVTQMPLSDTLTDFLTLVIEQDVTNIIMLNAHSDKSSAQYWPEEGQKISFKKFSVVSLDVEKSGYIQTRKLQISCGQDSRVVKQYQVLDWPDNRNIPSSPSVLLNIMEDIQHNATEAPILVHCMNGADKSGLFCTIMAIVDRLKVEHEVVIQQVIKQMRCRRPEVIPNMEQFQFCYEAVCTYIQAFETYANFS